MCNVYVCGVTRHVQLRGRVELVGGVSEATR